MKAINFNPTDFEPLRQIALQFPDSSDSLSHYDTPSIKIKKNLLCRLHENDELLREVLETGYEAIIEHKKK